MKPPLLRRPGVGRGRAATVARLVDRLTRETGVVPSNEQIARLLGTTARHVARARALRLGGAK
jgi:hypothetical protein